MFIHPTAIAAIAVGLIHCWRYSFCFLIWKMECHQSPVTSHHIVHAAQNVSNNKWIFNKTLNFWLETEFGYMYLWTRDKYESSQPIWKDHWSKMWNHLNWSCWILLSKCMNEMWIKLTSTVLIMQWKLAECMMCLRLSVYDYLIVYLRLNIRNNNNSDEIHMQNNLLFSSHTKKTHKKREEALLLHHLQNKLRQRLGVECNHLTYTINITCRYCHT